MQISNGCTYTEYCTCIVTQCEVDLDGVGRTDAHFLNLSQPVSVYRCDYTNAQINIQFIISHTEQTVINIQK